MALSSCVRVVPALVRRAAVTPPLVQPVRKIMFDPWSRSSDIRALVRDMDRQMERLEKEMFRGGFPSFPSLLPRLVPVSMDNTLSPHEGGGQYRVAVDLSGFKPEEIDISLDEPSRKLTINAKCERKGKDGSRFRQDMTRVVTLPEAIDINHLISSLHHNGYLTLEAPYKELPDKEPQKIPINKHGATESPQLEQQEASASSNK